MIGYIYGGVSRVAEYTASLLPSLSHAYVATGVALSALAGLAYYWAGAPSTATLPPKPLPLPLPPTPPMAPPLAEQSLFNRFIFHPETCADSKVGKVVFQILSLLFGWPFRLCFEDASQVTPATSFPDVRTLHNYPGDLPTAFPSRNRGNTLDMTLAPRFHVTIERNQDLLKSGVDVVVNAANTTLAGGGGIDGQIHSEGGAVYANAHADLSRAHHRAYPEGVATLLPSGNLTAKGVIVVAGPRGPTSDATKESQLYSTYYNSLLLAHSQGHTSIAFPSISTGIFGFPKERAAQISLRAIHDFIRNHPTSSLTHIAIYAPDFDAYQKKPAAAVKTADPIAQIAKEDNCVVFYKGGASAFLSNFYVAPFTVFGKTFQCSEAAFQWKKWSEILGATHPQLASFCTVDGEGAFQHHRSLEKQFPGRHPKGWLDKRNGVMWEILNAKLSQVKGLKEKLALTGEAYLLEHKDPKVGRDDYWSDGNGLGKVGGNRLGGMWMALRKQAPMPAQPENPTTVTQYRDQANTQSLGTKRTIW